MRASVLRDLRYGIRMMLRNPAYTAVAVLALALGIGANTATFSVADAFLLKPVSLPHLDRLVMVMQKSPQQGTGWNTVSPADFQDWKKQATSFESLSALDWEDMNITEEGNPEAISGVLVTPDFFNTLGVKPFRGRTFVPGEDQKGKDQVVIVSYGLWQRRFGLDANLVGKEIRLDGRTCEIVGIMPQEFKFPQPAQVWMPLSLEPKDWNVRGNHYLEPLARLKAGIRLSEAQAEMKGIAQRLENAYPDTNRGWSVRVVSIRDYVTSDYTRYYTYLLLAAVGFVLLIACANVANMQFARTTGRQKEIAMRLAMGASRRQLVRQLLAESVVVAVVSAALSLLFAEWAIELILAAMPPDVAKYISGWDKIGLDNRALLFTLSIGILSGIVSGLLPAFQNSRLNLNEALKEGGRSASASRSHHRIRSLLVISEISLALVLLVGAGLMVNGVRALIHINRNLEPLSLLTFHINLPEARYPQRDQRSLFYDQTIQKIDSVPGVAGATTLNTLPMSNGMSTNTFSIEGRRKPGSEELQNAAIQNVTPGYFRIMHIALRSGREFADLDGKDAPRAAIISENLARRYWPQENPIGRRIKLGFPESENPWMTIVGIAEDVNYNWSYPGPVRAIYQCSLQSPRLWSRFAVRIHGDPLRAVPEIRRQIASVDPLLPLDEVKTLDRAIHDSVIGLSYVAVMLTVMGVLALILASVGVYGVMGYAVSERTHEIGIRMALGAQERDVLGMVVLRGMMLTFIGLGIGLILAIFLARILSSLIFGVSSTDAATFIFVSVVLSLVALAACLVPARKASRVDPIVALRYE